MLPELSSSCLLFLCHMILDPKQKTMTCGRSLVFDRHIIKLYLNQETMTCGRSLDPGESHTSMARSAMTQGHQVTTAGQSAISSIMWIVQYSWLTWQDVRLYNGRSRVRSSHQHRLFFIFFIPFPFFSCSQCVTSL